MWEEMDSWMKYGERGWWPMWRLIQKEKEGKRDPLSPNLILLPYVTALRKSVP